MSTLYRLLQTKEFMSDKTWVQIFFIAQNKNKNVFMFLQWKWTGGGSGGQGVWHTVCVSVIIIYLLVIVLSKKIVRISLIKWVCQHRPHHMMYRFSKWQKCKETLQLFVHPHPPSSFQLRLHLVPLRIRVKSHLQFCPFHRHARVLRMGSSD